MALIVTMRAKEELAPFPWYALAVLVGEPHPLVATPRTILRGAMRIHLNAYDAAGIRFFFGELVDLAFQLIGLFAIGSPRFASSLRLDDSEPFKKQYAARILLADTGNGTGGLVGCIHVLAPDVSPQLLIAPFSFDCLARLPVFPGYAPQMLVAVLIQALIGHKARLDESAMLPDGDHRELLDIEIDRDRHQIGILLAFHYLFGADFSGLQEMNGSRPLREDQLGTRLVPSPLGSARLKIAVVAGGIVAPFPLRASIHLESDKALAQIQLIQFQGEGASIQCGMIAGGWLAWFAFGLACGLPLLERGQIASCFANAVFDHRTAIPIGEVGKRVTEVPLRIRTRMSISFHRLTFRERLSSLSAETSASLTSPVLVEITWTRSRRLSG